MSTRSTRGVRSLACAVAIMVTATACSSSGGGSASGSASGSPAPAAGLSLSQAKKALLTESEVGAGLSASDDNAPETAFPCTPESPPLDTMVPPVVKAQATFSSAVGDQQVTEEIDNYVDAATVAKALAAGTKGLGCHEGSVGDIDVIIDGPLDLSASFSSRLDKVTAWSITSATAKESLIVAHLGPQLIVLTFGATGESLPSSTVATITEKALTKVLKATK